MRALEDSPTAEEEASHRARTDPYQMAAQSEDVPADGQPAGGEDAGDDVSMDDAEREIQRGMKRARD
eukprot:3688608-Heterocapsa_arctica.AAC.1